jgi:hypothetical protein
MKIRMLFVSVMTVAALCVLHAADLNLEKDYKREIALYHIRPDQLRSLKRDSDGTPVSEPQLKEAVRNFYEWLYPLGPGFLKRFQFKDVVFKDTVYDRDGDTRQMRRIGSDLYLDADMDAQRFYVNMFYLQISVMQRTYLERWNKLNPDGFKYEDTRGSLSNSAQKKLDAVLAEWDKYFVSRTGMYSTEMDMAMTFAYMVEKGPAATAFVKKNSPDVQKKFDLIVDILESVKAAERGYMQTLLADDLSKLKTYVPYALAVRLEREYSGEWTVTENGDEAEGEKTAAQPPRGIGDPVEVAGRKINPLILALETKNSRLFNLLMENKADPNVANDKKVSALMLAIANNDPEQVKALLKAGAKVTQETARAGTASGVNAEIVKQMKSYLPGARQSEKTEKKQPEKSSGGTDSRKSSGTGLHNRLNAIIIDRFDFEDVGLGIAINFFRAKSKSMDPKKEGFQFSIPQSYEQVPVSVAVENVSMYEALLLISKSAGLELRLQEPNTVILSSPGAGEKKSGKK